MFQAVPPLISLLGYAEVLGAHHAGLEDNAHPPELSVNRSLASGGTAGTRANTQVKGANPVLLCRLAL
eukprot:810529-Prorocentrum_minimum.AAC.1